MTLKHASSSGNRIEFLDASRAVAALGVVVYHLMGYTNPAFRTWLIHRENIGLFGVYTFFISGFIIPVSLQRSTIRQFWRSRFFRLMPTYWFIMALALLLGAFGAIRLDVVFRSFHHPELIALNAVMLAPLLHKPAVLGTFWTLSIELLFYAICSGLKLTGLLPRRLLTAYMAITVYVVGLLFAIHGLIPPLLFRGEWLALLLAAFIGGTFYEVQQERLDVRHLIPLIALFLVVTYFGMRFDYAPGHHPPSALNCTSLYASWLEATAFFCLMFALRHRRFPAALLWIGRISYSLYLVQEIVWMLSIHIHSMPAIVVSLLGIVLCLLAADVCYRFIERPFLHFAKGRHKKDPVNPAQPILGA